LYVWRNLIWRLVLAVLIVILFLANSFNRSFAVSQEASTWDIIRIMDVAVYNTGPFRTEVAWKTDIASSSQVFWDTTAHEEETDYTQSVPLGTQKVFHHRQILAGLLPSSTYHYRVKSTFATGEKRIEAVSPDQFFITLPNSASSIFSLEGQITPGGIFSQQTKASSVDGHTVVLIEAGIVGLSDSGTPLYEISLALLENPPDPPEDTKAASLAYEIGPTGAVFDKSVDITISFSPTDLKESGGEPSVFIAWWDTSSGQWIALPSNVDNMKKTITARIDHFTVFSVFQTLKPLPMVKGGLSAESSVMEDTAHTTSAVSTPDLPLNPLTLWIIFFLVAISLGLGLFVFLYFHRRKKRKLS
jgi:hypothetical protein